MALAMSSFPVPLSPSTSTLSTRGATCWTFENTLHRRRLTDHVFETELGIHLRTQLAVFGFSFCERTARAIRISSSSICNRPLAM